MAFTPMSADQARAYAMALELHRLLGELCDLPENGPGSALDDAWNRMDDVVEMLEPQDIADSVGA